MGSIPLIVDMHAEDAAIQWVQRNRAVDAPHFNTRLLSRLDERLEANVDGLRVAGRMGWEAARAAFDQFGEAGEMFTLSTLAFGAGSARGIGEVLELLEADEAVGLLRPATSGLGWLEKGALHGLVQPLLDDKRAVARALGVGACLIHRVHPGDQLSRFLRDKPVVRERALSLVGHLGAEEWSGPYFDAADQADCQFRGAWADVRFGQNGPACEHLWDCASRPGPEQTTAFELCALLSTESELGGRFRTAGAIGQGLALRAAGLLGQVDMVPWLIDQMRGPETAKLAGESFSMITGADLAFLDLDGDGAPQTGPTDNPSDPNVELDADEDLPMPDPDKVAGWWARIEAKFQDAPRYYLGQPVGTDAYRAGFVSGYQRQRRRAALALAVADPTQPVLSWRGRRKLPKASYHAPSYWSAQGQ